METKVIETPGLGEGSCVMTLVEVGSAVNIANGNLFDSYAVSPHLKLPVSIAYNSRSARDSRFGYGWNDSLYTRLIRKKDGSVILKGPDGREEVFTKNPDGTFSSPPGNHDILAADTRVLFSDDMEKGIGAWIPEYPWAQISWEWNSPYTCWTDSPSGYYADSVHTALTLPLDISGVGEASLTFSHLFSFETYYDFGYIEISDDGGVTWTLLNSYTGYQGFWAEQKLNLDGYAGLPELLLRFRVIADASVRDDGWYIDDVEITGRTGYQLARKNGDTLFFDRDGKLSAAEDRNGSRLTYAYTGEMLSSVTGPYDRTLTFANDGVRITGIADSMGRSFSFAYDENGNLAMITDSAGNSRSFSYDGNHNLIQKSDAQGRFSRYQYDSHDRLISATDPEGNTRNISYDAPTLCTQVLLLKV